MDNIRHMLFEKIAAAGRTKEITLKLKVASTDESRVLTALNIIKIFGSELQTECKQKSLEESIYLRNKANSIFVSCKRNVTKLIDSWELYSKSIAMAPNLSQELSMAYANRSAVLIVLKKYKECVEDINRALELKYPNILKGKLFYRKIVCLKHLGQISMANEIVDEFTYWLKSVHLHDTEKKIFQDKLKSIANLEYSKSCTAVPKIENLPKFVSCKNISCASEALFINFNKKFGRHIVCNRRINPGEILIIEKPYATILASTEIYTHCSYCLQIYWSMIPCERCTYAMYCSQKCKVDAWKKYHDIECTINGILINLKYNICDLFSVRLSVLNIREAGNIEKLKADLQQINKDSKLKGFSADGKYHSDRYESLYSLVSNTEKRSLNDILERAFNAAYALIYLSTFTNIFDKTFNIKEMCINSDITYIGGLILRYMQIIPSNIHSYVEERGITSADIGASALPFCSLLNHSCNPNVSRCTTKNHMIIYALVPIEKGSQIYDNYGIHYAIMDKYERDRRLKQFYFNCACPPCKEDWPTYNNLLSYKTLVSNLDNRRKVEKALVKFNSYVSVVSEGNIDGKMHILEDLSEMIQTLVNYVPLPCQELNSITETLKKVFNLTYGIKLELIKLD